MEIFEQTFSIAIPSTQKTILTHLNEAVQRRLTEGAVPNRFVITKTSADDYECEVGLIARSEGPVETEPYDIFRFGRRQAENVDRFAIVLLVPTGIGGEIGGHAGDATPVARLLAEACDLLITHPNVVNASDINEIPDDALYVEGSILTRLLMGTIGLQPVRSNRVIVVIDDNDNEIFTNAAINAVNAARASFGFQCPKVVKLDPPITMRSKYQGSGRASGQIFEFERLLEVLEDERDCYDAVAVSSTIQVPFNYHTDYFDCAGEMVNPWGGVEALLTHTISSLLDVPSAHSPMFASQQIASIDLGIVEPRMAAEAVSLTFLQCILKGLHRSPRIVTDREAIRSAGVVTAEDVSCLVIPDGCLGLPTIAAFEQGIPVIAVRENANIMQNDLTVLPWAPGQLHMVENYWEAVGVISALKAGIAPRSVRRPFEYVKVQTSVSRSKAIQDRSARQTA